MKYTSLLGFYFVLALNVFDAKAEISVQPFDSPTKIRLTSSLTNAKTRAEAADSNFSPAGKSDSVAVLEQKLFRRGKRWTGEEDRRLLELREQQKSWEEIYKLYPERSWKALLSRYHHVLKSGTSKPSKEKKLWTKEEEELLLELVKTDMPWKEIVKQLPGRSVRASQAKYRTLSGRYNAIPKKVYKKWTAEEDKLLLEFAQARTPWADQVPFFEDRTIHALQGRYMRLKSLKTPQEQNKLQGQKYQRYTVAEFELMHELRDKGMLWKDIAAEYFPNRPSTSLAHLYKSYQARQQRGKDKEDNI